MNKFPANGLHQINSGFGVEKFDWWRPYCEDLLFNQLATTTGVNALLKEGGKFEEVHFPRIEKKLNWASFPSPAGGVAATLHIVHTTEQHPASSFFILRSSSHPPLTFYTAEEQSPSTLSMLQRSSHPPHSLHYRGAVIIHTLHYRAAVTRHPFHATEQLSPSVILILQSSSHTIHAFYPTEQQSPSWLLYYRAAVTLHDCYTTDQQSSSILLCYRAAAIFCHTY